MKGWELHGKRTLRKPVRAVTLFLNLWGRHKVVLQNILFK